LHVVAAAIVATALATLVAFDGPLGYCAKGALLVAAGSCLYALLLRGGAEPPSLGRFAEALGKLAIVELAAILTMTLDWSAAASRWVGAATQAAAGVTGIVACLRYMRWERLHHEALALRRSGRS
jgi:hypothetical protein